MKILWVFIILAILLPTTCHAEGRWYEGEESSSCDFACSMERVVASAPDGTAYMSQQEVSEAALKDIRIEQDVRASAFAPSSMAYDASSRGDAKLFAPANNPPQDAVPFAPCNDNVPAVNGIRLVVEHK